jgi:hypothetical protein
MEDGTSEDIQACGRIRIDSMAEPAFYVDLPYNEINGDGIDLVKQGISNVLHQLRSNQLQ